MHQSRSIVQCTMHYTLLCIPQYTIDYTALFDRVNCSLTVPGRIGRNRPTGNIGRSAAPRGLLSCLGTVNCSAVQCCTVLCSVEQCSLLQCIAVQSSVVQCRAVQCSSVQCSLVHIDQSIHLFQGVLHLFQSSSRRHWGQKGVMVLGYHCTRGQDRGLPLH